MTETIAPEALQAAKANIDAMSDEQVRALALAVRGQYARKNDTPEGFRDFYWCIFDREPPPYAMKEWIPRLYDAKEADTGLMLKAFRGSTKSTVFLGFTLFRQGHRPSGSCLVVMANDTAASKMGSVMADIIETNAGWKACFPNVVPDKERGWGAEGYFVKDTNIDPIVWSQDTLKDHGRDPSIIALGVTSGSINGMHPSNFLLLDDIHDENNTASIKEMENVKSKLKANIIPTISRPDGKPFIGVAYTPWNEQDTYAYLEATNYFILISTPLYHEVDGKKVYAWPEAFGAKAEAEARKLGEAEFARMFLLDLKAAQGINLRVEWLHEYPASEIGISWPVFFGVDFASTADKLRDKDRDYFALAIGRVIPGGGVVVVDGMRERFSTGEAFEKIVMYSTMYPTLRLVGVEKWGKGEEFFNLLRGNTSIPVLPLPVKGTAPKGKGDRFERQMAPMFEFSRAWISNAQTPFLRAFREEWAQFPGLHDDTLDAVYWMLVSAQGHLMPKINNESDGIQVINKDRPNPFNNLKARSA